MNVIGIDLGATNIRGAIVSDNSLSEITSIRIHSDGAVGAVLEDIYQTIDPLINKEIAAIGIGVPSVVDTEEGIVYDVQYIPSWKEVPLKQILEKRYNKKVFVNNDANCFVLGEYYFGKGRGAQSLIGLTIGTGLGGGVIIHNKLYPGRNCGAGEFGLLPYKDNILEYYCSGSFFKNVHGLDGVQVSEAAKKGNANALALYAELGTHIGNAIKAVIYTYDPELIVLGGSVAQAFDWFQKTMWQEIKTLAYGKSAERIRIEISNLTNSGILGAAALYYDAQ
ncbi:MAG TPA: ROK family protein [Puia sp.]|uniref:ROK family protein n=1 Tax=Puia sp. TaxID=2045100 RepID=UPI002B676FBE|nr:ROK family protein [Puia sp.]HVU94400.1 ROK family protein [Puia sp.]